MPLMIRQLVMVVVSFTSIFGYLVSIGGRSVRGKSFALSTSVGDVSADDAAQLRYAVIVSEPVVCTDSAITLELEMQNLSDHEILIDPRGLLYQVTVLGDSGGSNSVGDLMDDPKPSKSIGYFSLPPKEAYRKTIKYPLVKMPLFSRAGLYSLRLRYGQFALPSPKFLNLFRGSIESNEVLFRLKACSHEER
jgi:hypothetical protein